MGNAFVSLENLLTAERNMGRPVAFRDGESISWQQWRRRVEVWRDVVRPLAGQRFALFHSDALEFSAILFALWAEGKIATVPGNNQPAMTENLRARVAGFIGEFAAVETLTAGDTGPVMPARVLDLNAAVLEIFTSGSTGEPQAIAKQLRQLSNEVNNLELLWGESLGDATVLATVSHHHIYGLLFRVLWSLAAGRPFDANPAEYWEDLIRRACDWPAVAIIASPTHLSRMPAACDWLELRERCRAVFSSGAPLARDASLQAREWLACAPIEVYGSSETGGIAWRQQNPAEDTLWQPVPGITLALEPHSGCLQIQSSYLTDGAWYVTSDRARLSGEQQFQLLGRVDRIAKIEGKRLSLSEMERCLQNHALVEQVRVVVLQGKRSEVGAVAILTPAGRELLETQGRRRLNQLLQQHLAATFERPLLPRRWRYPNQLPVNAEGKVAQGDLLELFMNALDERPRFPQLLDSREDDGALCLTLKMPDDLLYFDGHFPVAAIVPGVVQVHWAQHYGRERLGLAGEFSHLEAIKFQHVIRPGQTVELRLVYDADKRKLQFSYRSPGGQHASGRLVTRAD